MPDPSKKTLSRFQRGIAIIGLSLFSAVALWGLFTFHLLTGETYKDYLPVHWIEADEWQMIDGQGEQGDEGLEMHFGGRLAYAVAAAKIDPQMTAANVSHVELVLNPGASRYELEVGWSETATFGRFPTHSFRVDESGRARLSTDELFQWRGDIAFILLRTRGILDPPVIIERVGLHPGPPAFLDIQRHLLSDWTDRRSWTQISINRTLISGGSPLVSPVLAVAVWVVVASLLNVIVFRRRSINITYAVLGVLLVGWVILDLRWQGEVLVKSSEARNLFQGKSWSEKRSVDVDGEIFTLMEDLKSKDAEPETIERFLISGPYEFAHQRARYFAMPVETHSSNWPPHRVIMRQVRRSDSLLLVDLPSVEFETVCDEGECLGKESENNKLRLQEIAGRHAELNASVEEDYIMLVADGTWLVESQWQEPPSAGYYNMQAELAVKGEPGRVMMQILQETEEGSREVIAERDFYVSCNSFQEVQLPVAISGDSRLLYRLRTFDAEGLVGRKFRIDPISNSSRLGYIVVRKPSTGLVVMSIDETDNARVFRIK